MLKIHYDPVMLYAQFKDKSVPFIVRYFGTIGDGKKDATAFNFYIHTMDEAIVKEFKRDGFIVTLGQPENTYIDAGTVRIGTTLNRIELLNSMYAAIQDHYDSMGQKGQNGRQAH